MALAIKKNLMLISTIVVIAIAAIGGYYLLNIKQGPYSAAQFVSVQYSWGVGDTLANHYNSATGDYQYLDAKDSLIHTNVKLHSNQIIYIHSKANELDFWNLPAVIANTGSPLKSDKILRYEMVFTYEGKTKKIVYLSNYDEDIAIADKALQLQRILAETINEAEERYQKK